MPFVKVREPFGYSRLPSTSNVVPFAMRDGEASGTVEDDVALARSVTEESEGAKESKAVALGEREPDRGTVADAVTDGLAAPLVLFDETAAGDVLS